jgi:hypothetical protein
MRVMGVMSLAAALMCAAPAALAQAAPQPTDLNGTWTNASLTGLNRPTGVDKLILSKAEAEEVVRQINIAGFAPEGSEGETVPVDAGAPVKGSADFGVKAYDQFWVAPGEHLAVVKGEFRSSYVVDPPSGRVPVRTDLPQRAQSTRYVTGIGGNEGPEAPPLSERCLIGFGNTGGPGMLSTLYNNTYQFVQAPDAVMILVEMVHDARIIPTFANPDEAKRAHRPAAIKPWLGDSVGWYEGKTLVVETINIRPDQVRVSSIPISENGRITERFTRISDNEIFYEFGVDDPATYSAPWRAELSFYATPQHVYEYACHEGNYAMEGILGGARRLEAAAEADAKPRKSSGKSVRSGKTR